MSPEKRNSQLQILNDAEDRLIKRIVRSTNALVKVRKQKARLLKPIPKIPDGVRVIFDDDIPKFLADKTGPFPSDNL